MFDSFMSWLMAFNDWLNGIVWGPYMLILLVGTGIYLSVRSNFLQVTKLGYILKQTLGKVVEKPTAGEGDITPFQALTTALASTVGTGNLAGVATAIAIGGPGAIFWMWVSGFFGMMTKFGEVVLSVHFREKKADGSWAGGPMYYLTKGLKQRWLAVLFAFFGAFAALGIGNMVQSNSVADALKTNFNIPYAFTGIALVILAGLVIIGGIKRIAQVTEKLVPFMAVFYIIGAVFIILTRVSAVPEAFALIFKHAFTPISAVGGFAGAAVMQVVRFGVARGVFSNEAGLGSAPIAHATARTDHPVRQGFWGIFEVFIDTIVICTLTALAIVVTGVWKMVDPSTGEGFTGAALTSKAYTLGLPGPGGYIIAIGIIFFAYSTLLGWSFYGEKCFEYLIGSRRAKLYRYFFLPFIFLGAVGALEPIWLLADTLNGLMAIPNLIGVLGMSGLIIKLTRDFFRKNRS